MALASAGPYNYASLHLAPDRYDNHASTPPLSFLQAGYPSCRPTNSVNALNMERNLLQYSFVYESSDRGLATIRHEMLF